MYRYFALFMLFLNFALIERVYSSVPASSPAPIAVPGEVDKAFEACREEKCSSDCSKTNPSKNPADCGKCIVKCSSQSSKTKKL